MCGIVGFLTEEKWNRTTRNRYVEQALVTDTLRGEDATGIFVVPQETLDGSPGWAKEACDGYTFVTRNKYFKKFIEAPHYAVIGHNRAATIGKGIDAAHPFQEGAITLVHNGTLADTTCLPISQREAGAANDSHTIAINLSKHTLDEVIPKLDGSFALVWHDQRDGMIRIIRNSKRPLHLAKLKNESTVLIASEAGMLMWLAARLKLTVEAIYQPDPMVLMEFKSGTLEFSTRKFEEYVPPVKSWPSYGGWTGGGYYGYTMAPTPLPTERSHVGSKSTVTVLGREMEVPEYLQDELFSMDLLPESRCVFLPLQRIGPEDAKYVSVVGSLEEENETAVLHGVPGTVAKHAWDRRWVVRPTGVNRLSQTEDIVVCKLVSANADSEYGRNALAEGYQWGQPLPGEAKEETDLSLTEYLLKTQGGCKQCSRALCGDDMEDTLWLDDGSPICPECVEDSYKNLKEVS